MQHLQTEGDDSSMYLALLISVTVCAVVVFLYVPLSPVGTDHINRASFLMQVTENPNKAPSLCFQSVFLSLARNPDGTTLYITA